MDIRPQFVAEQDVFLFHDELIALYHGDGSLRDYGLLASALKAPENRYQYDENATLGDLAASYAFHISNNQPFADGNKRTGLQTAIAFLKLNGFELAVDDATLYEWMMMISSGVKSEQQLADSMSFHCSRSRGLTIFIRRLFVRW